MAAADAPTQQTMACNQEGEELLPPLPSSWTLDRLQNGDLPVKIYTSLMSPGGFRLRTLLKFYEIPFECTESGYKKVDPSYQYKKMPVVRIGSKEAVANAYQSNNPELGRLINDTYITVKSLGEVIQGRPFADHELEIMKQTTFGLQYPLLGASIKAGKMSGKVIDELMPHAGCCTKCCTKCVMGCCAPYCCCPCCCNEICCGGGKLDKIFKADADKFGVQHTKPGLTQSFASTAKWYGVRLQGKSFFAGDTHGVIDIDVFAIMYHNTKMVGNPMSTTMLEADAPLKAWYERMVKIAGHVDHLQGLKFADPMA